MPRAFDRGVPDLDKDPLRQQLSYSDPEGVIGQAAEIYGQSIQRFMFDLFTECGEFVQGLAEFGRDFLTDLLETLTEQFDEALGDLDEELAASLQEIIDQVRASLASPNPLVLIGTGLQAVIDSVWRLFNCPDPEDLPPPLNPLALLDGLQEGIDALLASPFIQGLVALADLVGDAIGNFILDAIQGAGRLLEILCGIATCNPAVVGDVAAILGFTGGPTGGTTPFTLIEGIMNILTPVIESPFVQGLVAFAEFIGRETGNFILDVFNGLVGLADWICGVLTCNPNAVGTTPMTLINGIQEVIDRILEIPFIAGIIEWAEEIGVAVGNFALDILNGIMGMVQALCSLITTGQLPTEYGDWLNTPLEIIGDISDIVTAILENPFVAGVLDLIEGSGKLFFDFVVGSLQFITNLGGVLGFLNPANLLEILQDTFGWLISFFSNVIDTSVLTLTGLVDALKSWLGGIPVIGQLLGLAGSDTINGKPITTLDDLVLWFQTKVLTIDKAIPAKNLFGSIPAKLLSSIGVGNVDDSLPNQVDLNTFPEAAVMQVGGRWSWDGGESTAAGSGSAKVTCASAAARMFSNKIPVAPGQLLSLQAYVKWSGLSNNNMLSSPISIGVRTLAGGVVQQQFFPIASIPTVGLGANAGWTLLQNTIAWQVPGAVYDAQGVLVAPAIDEVRMAIGVNQSATAGTVWFDDIALRKTNKMDQNLVSDLVAGFTATREGLTGVAQGSTVPAAATATNMYTPASGVAQGVSTERGRVNSLNLNLYGSTTPTNQTKVQAAAVPDITRGMSADLQGNINALVRGFRGPSWTSNYPTSEAQAAAERTSASVAEANANVAALQASAAAGTFSGTAISVDFSTVTAGALPNPPWSVSSSSGSPGISVSSTGRRVVWTPVGTDNRSATAIHQTQTATDYPRVSAVIATSPGQIAASGVTTSAFNYLHAQSNATGTSGVYLRLSATTCELYAANTNTKIAEVTDIVNRLFVAGSTYSIECSETTGTPKYKRYRIYRGGTLLIDHTDAAGQVTIGGKFAGFGAQAAYSSGAVAQMLPGELAAFSFYDAVPAATVGSGFRISRSSTSGIALISSTSGAEFPAGASGMWLNSSGSVATPDFITSDLTYSSTTGRVRVTAAGWYLVSVGLQADSPIGAGLGEYFRLAVFRGVGTNTPALHSVGQDQWGTTEQYGFQVAATFAVYCNAGDHLSAGYESLARGAAATHTFVGDVAGTQSYFSVVFLNNTRPS